MPLYDSVTITTKTDEQQQQGTDELPIVVLSLLGAGQTPSILQTP